MLAMKSSYMGGPPDSKCHGSMNTGGRIVDGPAINPSCSPGIVGSARNGLPCRARTRMSQSDVEVEFEALRRTWRNVTREWLTARNAMARLQDEAVVDLRMAAATSRRLEQAERQRIALNQRLEELQRRLETRGA